ncbi:cupin-like domain-containing protein [Luteibacter aegosomaticola]|uniref:cupin-like domain-containing protein n=1 Tax=Luteibacter aegosomaticola TaxID=2911538 RepID=UPI001FF927D1|nr:cupin-like domain-containing protein [Luteibacter aegosomaticola]UPG89729.1 cupin-like domain-containing protein [Luteibacter aegosomaticola]
MKARAIPVIDVAEFARLYRENPRVLHDSPWIISGYIQDWPSYAAWQDLGVLRERFGHIGAFAKAPNFVTHRSASLVSVETDFARYLDYIEQPDRARELYEGRWLEGSYEAFAAQDLPLYCGTLRFVHRADDPTFAEVFPLVPAPLQPVNHALPYYYSLFNHLWLLVSLPGALTPLHVDNNGTIAMIAQLRGRKRATLYAPRDLAHVYQAGIGFMDPEAPDDTEFPTWREATPWHAELLPGQVLYVGTEWAHHVRTLETSVSVSFDFVDESNLADYAISPDWATVLGQRVKARPDTFLQKLSSHLRSTDIATLPPVELGRKVMRAVLASSLATDGDGQLAAVRASYLRHLDDLAMRGAA